MVKGKHFLFVPIEMILAWKQIYFVTYYCFDGKKLRLLFDSFRVETSDHSFRVLLSNKMRWIRFAKFNLISFVIQVIVFYHCHGSDFLLRWSFPRRVHCWKQIPLMNMPLQSQCQQIKTSFYPVLQIISRNRVWILQNPWRFNAKMTMNLVRPVFALALNFLLLILNEKVFIFDIVSISIYQQRSEDRLKN